MTGILYLAVDGGGTNTRARLYDESDKLIGEGLSGSSNLTLGTEIAGPAIAAAGDAALAAAGLGPEAKARIHAGLGLSGGNIPALAESVAAFPFGYQALTVTSDAVTACLGAHAGKDGGILILGTGSQGLALVEGKETAIGGWGFALGDDASGAVLGRAALHAAMLSVDLLGPVSDLTRRLLAHFHDNPNEAVIWAKTAKPRDYGHFAPLVFQAAGGDVVADHLIAGAVGAIVGMLDRLIDLGAPKLTLMGGLAEPYRPFLPVRYDEILVPPKGDAVAGALALAKRGPAR